MARITRRGVLAAAAALGGGRAGGAAAQEQQLLPHERELHEAARREGELTWYTGQMQAEPSEAIGRAFTERFPGVKVNVVRSTSQVAFQRLSQDARAGVAQCDVFSSVDQSHLTLLKRQERLAQYRPQNASGLIPAVREAGDPDGCFQVSYLAIYLIGRHRRVTEAEAPRGWRDLLDPRWRGQIAVGHPGFSGAIGSLCVALRKLYGWDYFRQLERNRPHIGRSAGDPVTLLNAGERTIGMGVPSPTTLLSIARGNPLALVYPADGTLMVPAPSGALRNAPHPNAARLFLEFIASPAYSRATRPFFAESLRPEVPPPDGARPLDQVPLLMPTAEEVERGIPEVKELWRDTFGV
jgi:iron(III) transport system substrate-binding protein